MVYRIYSALNRFVFWIEYRGYLPFGLDHHLIVFTESFERKGWHARLVEEAQVRYATR